MKKEEIHFPDWQRLLLGNTPWEFMIEILLRTIIIYTILLIVVRMLGKRMSAQMTITEMAIMITIGGIVSVPMQTPERGLIQGIVILACVVIFQYALGRISFKHRAVETTVQGDLTVLIKDGRIEVGQLKKAGISNETLFGQLRGSNIQQLGQVKRTYLEACGIFSVITYPKPKPGLSIIPIEDKKIKEAQKLSNDNYSCNYCGNTIQAKSNPHTNCDNCGNEKWVRSVVFREERKMEESTVAGEKDIERESIRR
jgi:uncharacterized membrane protein YcaP (DUF421 family)